MEGKNTSNEKQKKCMVSRTQAGDKYLTDENCLGRRSTELIYRIIKKDIVIPKASPNGSIHVLKTKRMYNR